ncbi:phosphohydrolase, partial [Candidatus Bathyarchaeota archaeon]
MVKVSPNLVFSHLDEPKIAKAFKLLESDLEVQAYLHMTNVMAVGRLGYNDHGPVHSKITSGSALEIFEILSEEAGSTLVRAGVCRIEDAELVVLCGAYLHDIGNAVHREQHHIHGYN